MKAQETAKKVAKKWPSDHVNHWRDKLFFQKWTEGGECRSTSDLYVRFQIRGKRKAINLGTSNREEAAKKARDFYLLVRRDGWDAIEHLKCPKPAAGPSVGDVIRVLETRATHLSRKSLKQYATALRLLAGGVAAIDIKKTGRAHWRAAVDNVAVSSLTPQAVREWRGARQKEAADPISAAKRVTHLNSILRNARGCFSPAMQPHFADARFGEIRCPFDGVKLERNQRSRVYRSEIDHQELINHINALPRSDMRIALVIALTTGLRRSEMDRLKWTHIDFDAGTLSVETTEEGAVKSVHSARLLHLDPWCVETLRGHRGNAGGASHVIAGVLMKGNAYRAEDVFREAVQWLRQQGVTSTHPLHTLRKEFGSQVAALHGIAAAAKTLGHADFSNVTAVYVDAKGKLTSGIAPNN